MMKPSEWPKQNDPGNRLTLGGWLTKARLNLRALPEEPESSLYAIAARTLDQPTYWPQAHPEYVLTPDQQELLDDRLSRLLQKEPLAYILNHQAFFSLDFYVTPDVLIPRPETELLVEVALDRLAGISNDCIVADTGTGSGCIALALACNHPQIQIVATDVSFKSLQVAKVNIQRHHQERRIALLQSDLLAGVRASFDLICANLPYIPTGKLDALEVSRHEPLHALDGGADGLAQITRLLLQARERLKPGGMILLEMESNQSEAIRAAIHGAFPRAGITIVQDLRRLPRLAIVENR